MGMDILYGATPQRRAHKAVKNFDLVRCTESFQCCKNDKWHQVLDIIDEYSFEQNKRFWGTFAIKDTDIEAMINKIMETEAFKEFNLTTQEGFKGMMFYNGDNDKALIVNVSY